MNRRPRKMTKVYSNVRQMLTPVKSEKVSQLEKAEMIIEEIESDIFLEIGDNPLLEVLSSPKVIHLQKRLASMLKKKENIGRTKKKRERHHKAAE